MRSRREFLKLSGLSLGTAGLCSLAGCEAARADFETTRWFRDVSSDAGFAYASEGHSVGTGQGGVFVADVTNNGFPDVLTTGGATPTLFENEGGTFRESDALPEIDAGEIRSGLFFDADNSGLVDLLLVPSEESPLFYENVGGRLKRRDAGFDVSLNTGIGATAADSTGNGYPDVFIYQNGNWATGVPAGGKVPRKETDNGTANYLFRNEGGSFRLAEDAGIEGNRWSLAASFVDLTGDGRPDLHVANDFNTDVLYENRGDGTFTRREIPGTHRHGMSSEVGDVNGDGRPDIFVTNIRFAEPEAIWGMKGSLQMNNDGNYLLVNHGDGTFEDKATEYGIRDGQWGWAAELADFTNNGELDLVHTRQFYRVQGKNFSKERRTRPKIWMKEGDEFVELNPKQVGLEYTDGRGIVTLDFNGDGRLDLVVGNNNGQFYLYENELESNNWLQVDVRDDQRTAIGTKVDLKVGDEVQSRIVTCRADFYSQSWRVLHFGLGRRESADELTLRRGDGMEQTFRDVDANQRLTVTREGISSS